jgi:polyisoprenoid-binding protein YceI
MLLSMVTFAQSHITKIAHVNIFSSTIAEDITANNYTTMAKVNTETGSLIFSIPVQGFEFDKALMQKHFNQKNFMDSKQFPKIKFVGNIVDMSKIDFSKNGTYTITVSGSLTIRGVTEKIIEKGTISINNGEISATSVFTVKGIYNYGVGRPTSKKKTNNVAEDIVVTVTAEFK